jgi:hypothetical protein
MPYVQGEMRFRGAVAHISGGPLRERLNMNADFGFVDFNARVQAGRFSFCVGYEPRHFRGMRNDAEARFDYPGVNLALQADLIQRHRSRLGFDIGFDTLKPEFIISAAMAPLFYSDPNVTISGARFTGPQGVNAGFHVVLNPMTSVFGLTGIFEAKALWPIAGTMVRKWEIEAGLKTAETVVGSWSLKGGYGRTDVDFTGTLQHLPAQIFTGWEAFTVDLTYHY